LEWRPHAAEAGGKPATGALPHGDGRDDCVGVWIDARDVIHVAVGNPNGAGSEAIQSGAPGIEIFAITGSEDTLTEVRSGMVTLPQTSAAGRVSPQRKNT
jgi:hypothetical protein